MWAGFDKELCFKLRCKQSKDHPVNQGDQRGGGSAQGLGQVTMAKLGQLGQGAHAQDQPGLGGVSKQLLAAHVEKPG